MIYPFDMIFVEIVMWILGSLAVSVLLLWAIISDLLDTLAVGASHEKWECDVDSDSLDTLSELLE